MKEKDLCNFTDETKEKEQRKEVIIHLWVYNLKYHSVESVKSCIGNKYQDQNVLKVSKVKVLCMQNDIYTDVI